jgi:hypothetical protein
LRVRADGLDNSWFVRAAKSPLKPDFAFDGVCKAKSLFDATRGKSDAFASLRHVFLSSDRLFSADVELFCGILSPDCRLSTGMGSTETQLIAHWFIDRSRPTKEPIVPVG